jgi:hypothetical protein
MDDAAAVKRLNLLLKEEGALKIINHFHACNTDQLVLDSTVAAADEKSDLVKQCRAYAREHGHVPGMVGGYQSVGHYRLHDVKRIEAEDGKEGWYSAYADDDLGTCISGKPVDLLRRLTEHESA